MVFDFRGLSRWELIIGAGGIALLVVLLVPDWYGVRAEEILSEGSEVLRNVEVDARNAFGSFTWLDIALLATAIAALALPLLRAVRPELRLGRWPALVLAVLASVAVALLALRLIDPPDLARTIEGTSERVRVSDVPGVDVFRKLGAWLGLALAAVIALAGGLEARKPR